MKSVYIVILNPRIVPNNETLIVCYNEDKNIVHEYLHFIGRDEDKIFKISEDELNKIKESGKYQSVELIEDYGNGMYITELDLESVSMNLEYECLDIAKKLKKMKNRLKIFKSKYSKNLIKSIDIFLKSEVKKHTNLALDFMSTEGRLIEKIRERYYTKKVLRDKYYEYGGD